MNKPVSDLSASRFDGLHLRGRVVQMQAEKDIASINAELTALHAAMKLEVGADEADVYNPQTHCFEPRVLVARPGFRQPRKARKP